MSQVNNFLISTWVIELMVIPKSWIIEALILSMSESTDPLLKFY